MSLSPVVVDSLERVGVTVALSAVSLLAVAASDWPLWWAPLLVALLNGIKVLLAARVGDPNTGGFTGTTVPGEVDPVSTFDPDASEGSAVTEDH